MTRLDSKWTSRLACAFGALAFAGASWAVDGVVLIDQAKVNAAGGFPYKISQPGSYRLASNLNVSTTTVGIFNSGIVITSDNVVLDLNGFTISGAADYGVQSTNAGVTVSNGTVKGFNLYGVKLGSRCHIEAVQALSNGRDGLNCSTGSLIRGNRVVDNSALTNEIDLWSGIVVGWGSIVSDNVVANNKGNGIAGPALVVDNVITSNGIGINGFNPGATAYARNVLLNNGSAVYGVVSLGPNYCNGALCP